MLMLSPMKECHKTIQLYTRLPVIFTNIYCAVASSSNMSTSVEPPDFSEPWMFSDVVLVVEDQKFHVHRFVLAMRSLVFKKMFTSGFKEKNMNEIALPGKEASEIKELLLIIYPTVSGKGWKSVTNENCYFLLKLADEYQMDDIKQRCEDVLVEKVTSVSENTFLSELEFAQKYTGLDNLRKTIVNKAALLLRLDELKNHEMYNEMMKQGIYQQILEEKIRKYEGYYPQYGYAVVGNMPVARPI